MARAPDERYNKGKKLFPDGRKLIEIANQLNLPEGTVHRWKSTHKWDTERSDKKSERSHKHKGGSPEIRMQSVTMVELLKKIRMLSVMASLLSGFGGNTH